MEEHEKLESVINTSKESHRDPLRRALRVAKQQRWSLTDLAGLTVESLACVLAASITSRTRAAVKNPKAMAKKIRKALLYVAEKHPHLAIPVPTIVPDRATFPQVAIAERPRGHKDDMAAWWSLNEQVRGRETRGRKALMESTKHVYDQKLSQLLGVAISLGYVVDGSFGIRTLTRRAVIEKILALLDAKLSQRSVAGFVAAATRVALDLLEDDPSHLDDINYLKSELKRRFPSTMLDADDLLELDNLASGELFAVSLRDAPDVMAERAHQPGLKPLDRMARLAAALAVELKLTHPAVSSAYTAALDLAKHVEQVDGIWKLRVPDPEYLAAFRHEDLTRRAVRLKEELEGDRAEAGITSTLLFPSRHGRLTEGQSRTETPQLARISMTFVAGELEAVMGHRLTWRSLKGISVHVTVKHHPDKVHAIAQAHGIRHPNNLAIKMHARLNRRSA